MFYRSPTDNAAFLCNYGSYKRCSTFSGKRNAEYGIRRNRMRIRAVFIRLLILAVYLKRRNFVSVVRRYFYGNGCAFFYFFSNVAFAVPKLYSTPPASYSAETR